eukprot:g37328.t1
MNQLLRFLDRNVGYTSKRTLLTLDHFGVSCPDHLVGIFADIFNLSMLQSEAPTCLMKTTVIPVPKKHHATCLNDLRPVALTSKIERLKSVKIDNSISSTITLNTGTPCVLCPLLYSLYTRDCVPKFCANATYTFTDDTTIVGWIANNDETEYRKE